SFIDQAMIDLDGTENKSRIGANAILAVSLAVAKAAAEESGLPLYRYLGGAGMMSMPVPLMNLVNGGAHANNNIDMQEFMIVPFGIGNFRDAIRCGSEIFHALKKLLNEKNMPTTVGDEGGFAPNLNGNEESLQLIVEAIDLAGHQPGRDVAIAVDCASSEYFSDGKYHLSSDGLSLTSAQFADYLASWVDKYPIISIEDGMSELDWNGWELLTNRLGKAVQLVGDDIFV